MSYRSTVWYVAITLLVSWCLQIPAILLWGLGSAATKAVFFCVMWSPSVIAIMFLMRHAQARRAVLWRLGKIRFLAVGVLTQAALGFAVVGILIAMGLASSGWFDFAGYGVKISGGPWLLGTGAQSWLVFVINVALTSLAFSALNLVAATGEEFAWRGFLQSHLVSFFGVLPGILVLAAVWWAWHLPGLLFGYNFPEHPYLGAFVLFPLQMIGASLFFGWLAIRAGSFWPAALAHGAVNSVQQAVVDNLQLSTSELHVDLLRTALILAVGALCWCMPGGEKSNRRILSGS
jgi:uncharacterized protein